MSIYIPSKKVGHNGYIKDNSFDDDCDYTLTQLRWCRSCVHYGFIDRYNACADGNAFTLWCRGPLAVSYCGYCNHFVNKHSKEGKEMKPYSKLKQKLLEGMQFHKSER